jgi:serine phosphatase RsbU (regulator of sigma subunit)
MYTGLKLNGETVGAPEPLQVLEARRENEIASRIQSSILPGEIDIEGLEISAGMLPTEVIGGDYYDIIPVQDGCWIGIGDVAGHGLAAGMIMLMIQSTLQGLVLMNPTASPRELVCVLNQMLFENIRKRMKRDEHVTFSLVRYSADGSLVVAGAHENILICRATGGFDSIPSRGVWLGARKDISSATEDTSLQLGPGDLMVLYTDGVIEAMNAERAQFGPEQLERIIREHRDSPPYRVRNVIMDALREWTVQFEDDVTLVVIRCQGVYWESSG